MTENNNQISKYNNKYRELITEEQLKIRVKELGAQISNDYKDKCPIIIGVLNGAFVFMADLLRELTIDCEVDFLKISSYNNAKKSSEVVKLKKNYDSDIDDRDVIVIEDIVDSGRSIKFLTELFAQAKPKSLKFVSLLLKQGGAVVDFELDYTGFQIPDEFVVGYGLDHAQKLRNLPSIHIVG